MFIHSDPHTTQRSGSVGDKSTEMEVEMDETFHQKYAARINFKDMDPSLALVRKIFNCLTYLNFVSKSAATF